MTECCQQTFGFHALGSGRVEADFSGGHLSSDGGVLLLRETDQVGHAVTIQQVAAVRRGIDTADEPFLVTNNNTGTGGKGSHGGFSEFCKIGCLGSHRTRNRQSREIHSEGG